MKIELDVGFKKELNGYYKVLVNGQESDWVISKNILTNGWLVKRSGCRMAWERTLIKAKGTTFTLISTQRTGRLAQ